MHRLVLLLLSSIIGPLVLNGMTSSCFGQSNDNRLVYHIFVPSFADSDNDAKKYGDLKGITQKLDSYLNDGDPNTDDDLEVGILWLMPIFPADSYHGYNVKDYRTINSDLGTLDDLKELIKEAHQRGVRIILDIPFNHTSNNHPWFQQALQGDQRMRNRYLFRDVNNPLSDGWHLASHNGQDVQYFGLFDRSMPDLNFDNSDVRNEIKQIARYWLDLGVDGFRLDAAKHIYGDSFGGLSEPQILKNNDWWLDFSNHCYSINPDAILVGEVLGGQETIRRHSYGLEALLDEPFMHDVRNQIAFPQEDFVGRVKSRLGQSRAVNDLAPHVPNRPYAPFLFVGSHDENPRLASLLEEHKKNGMEASVDQANRMGAYLLLTIAEYPVIYYGEEIMQRGFKWNGSDQGGDGSGIYDETLREPFPWTKSGQSAEQTVWFQNRFDKPDDGVSVEEQGAEGGLLDLVRGITNLRSKYPAFANGEIGKVLTDSRDWIVFERVGQAEKYLVLINQTNSDMDYHFHSGWYPQYQGAKLMFWSNGNSKKWKDTSSQNENIQDKVFVPSHGLVVLKQS